MLTKVGQTLHVLGRQGYLGKSVVDPHVGGRGYLGQSATADPREAGVLRPIRGKPPRGETEVLRAIREGAASAPETPGL